MLKISKSLLFNPAQIRISGIKCSSKNITKIFNALDCKWVAVTIDSLRNGSSLITLIKQQGLKYLLKQHSPDHIEVSVAIPYYLCDGILEKAIGEDPENIFVFNLLDPTSWDIQLQHSFEELVATGITDLFVSASLDENALLISANKLLIRSQDLYKKIKALRFD